MKLTGLHLLLSYQCTFECDHCFVWGSPKQSGTFTLESIRRVLLQARDLDSIDWIYFEGGEPFLYYATLLQGTRLAASMGFRVGIVTNCYWAVGFEDAYEALAPFIGLVQDLTVSSDLYHYDEKISQQARIIEDVAHQLDIPIGMISVAQPDDIKASKVTGQLPEGESGVMYRGRAAVNLAPQALHYPWDSFNECPYEDLRNPSRIHLDSFGNLHICQGITIGNLFQSPLKEICESYKADRHPVISALLHGGPVELARRFDINHAAEYADACNMCYEIRRELRSRFPAILKPDQMYGVLPLDQINIKT